MFDCRGAKTEEDYIKQSRKIYRTIAEIRPAVVALQEMQNDAEEIAIAQFCAELNAFINTPSTSLFTFVKSGKTGTDVTHPAIIYDTKLVDLVGAFAVLDYGGKSRPSIAQTFKPKCSTDRFTVVSNHLKSKLPTG